MRRYFGAPRLGALVVLAATIGVGVFAGDGLATAGKPYSATITPTAAAAGVPTTFAYTVTNRDGQQPLGSFRILIPAGGWAVTGASITSMPSGKAWSLMPDTLASGYIEAKAKNNNARLSKDQAVVVSFTAAAPCSGGPFVFQSEAHQANQFLGPNNEFTQVNADGLRTVTLQSDGTVASVTIDSVTTPQTAGVPFAVTVRTYDACGNPTMGAALATLSGFNPSPAPIGKLMDVGLSSDSGSSATFAVTAYRVETASLVATVGSLSSSPSNAIQVGPGELGSFAIDSIASPQHAGTSFSVVAHPFDKWGNAKTNYAGGALLGGNLSDSAKPDPSPSTGPNRFPVYGSFTWGSNGDGTASVTAKKAETERLVTVTDSSPLLDAPVAASSLPFTVEHGDLTLGFASQPGAAELSTPIPSTTPPDPISVLVEDVYGNVAPDGTAVTMTAPSVLSGTKTGTTTDGLAGFPNLSIGVAGTYQLTARLDGSSPLVTATSEPFGIVNDLQNCTDVQLCSSTADNGNQTTTSKITTSSTTFQNIVLTTSFLDISGSRCSSFTPVPRTQLTDVSIQSGNVTEAEPEFTITLIIPKRTLQAAGYTQRSADSFDACAGAKWIDPFNSVVPWTTKSGTPAALADDGFYWGIAPDCSSFPPTTSNPCVLLKTKNESQLLSLVGPLPAGVSFKSGDLALVIRERFGWDGRISIGG